jgi:recombination protein RecR
VVEEVLDIMAFEKTGEFHGLYHVLQGVISPVNGVGPQDLTIDSLKNRVETQNIQEIILATNPTIEGEATALYISKILQPFNVRITRIARGLPTGSDLEYADKLTLLRSLQGRQEYF